MDFIDSYKDIFGVRRFVSVNNLRAGSVIQFTYDNEQKYALVLNPEWEEKMHALSLRSLSPTGMKSLLEAMSTQDDDYDEIYENFKTSEYVENRPYRTYIINKMKSIREIYIKPEPTPKPSPSPTPTPEPKEEPIKTPEE